MTTTSRVFRWCVGLLVPLLGICVLLLRSDDLFSDAAAHPVAFSFPACSKVWAHRGYAQDGGENSVQSIQSAFDRGAAGVEVDILYDKTLDDFVVSHDAPYRLFDGKPLMLTTVLSKFKGSGLLWLDAKNLSKLPPQTAYRATRRLSTLVQDNRLATRAFVESSNALYLSWLAKRNVYTSLTMRVDDRKYSSPIYRLNVAIMKLAYAYVGSGAISMGHHRYTPATAAAFRKAPILLSTVNEPKAIRQLSTVADIKVVLTDGDHYALDACAAGAG